MLIMAMLYACCQAMIDERRRMYEEQKAREEAEIAAAAAEEVGRLVKAQPCHNLTQHKLSLLCLSPTCSRTPCIPPACMAQVHHSLHLSLVDMCCLSL